MAEAEDAENLPEPTQVVKQRLATWDENGNPITTVVPVLTKKQVQDAVLVAASTMYEDPLGLEPEYAGMTNIEVIIAKKIKAAAISGDRDQGNDILDRILGKPKQTSESVNVKVSYEDYIKQLAEAEDKKDAVSTDAEPDFEDPLA